MSDLVENPEDRFSYNVARMQHAWTLRISICKDQVHVLWDALRISDIWLDEKNYVDRNSLTSILLDKI